MQKLIAIAIASLFAANLALAADKPAAAPKADEKKAAPATCEAQAIGKNGKPLAGAAKANFIKKCEKDAKVAAPAKAEEKKDAKPVAAPAKAQAPAASGCEAKAVSKDGKPLAGAAKAASIKKCEKDAAAPKAEEKKAAPAKK